MLCLGYAPSAWAADVPVVGIATGDATRGPLVDYLQAMASVRLRTPGYSLVSPANTARLVESIAISSQARVAESTQEDYKNALRAAADAVENEEWVRARAELARAVTLMERDAGTRVILGTSEIWSATRVAWAATYFDEALYGKKRKKISDEALAEAAEAVRPIFDFYPDYNAEGQAEELVELLDAVRNELRRSGALSVSSSAKGADVFVNGHLVGQTPLTQYRLTAGKYEVIVGRIDRPSRAHLVELSPGGHVEVYVDPAFEFDLTTEGYAIVEAPPGQSASATAVYVGSGIARLTDSRYALVFSVEGISPPRIYAALVDAESNVVLNERSIEVAAGPVQSDKLYEALLFAIEGKEVDHSWPAYRWGWVIGTVASTVLAVSTGAVFFTAYDYYDQSEDPKLSAEEVKQLEDDGNTLVYVGWVLAAGSAVALGVTIYFAVVDASTEEKEVLVEGDWWLQPSPIVDGGGKLAPGFSFGLVF